MKSWQQLPLTKPGDSEVSAFKENALTACFYLPYAIKLLRDKDSEEIKEPSATVLLMVLYLTRTGKN